MWGLVGMLEDIIIPDELRFAVTRKCDGACRHCYNKSGQDVDKLTTEDYIRLLKEIYQLNPNLDRITLTGGEPLNEKERVITIAQVAQSLGIRVRLVTRGWELSPEVCEELKEVGVTRIQVGLDSSGSGIYKDDSQTEWDTFHSWLRGDHDGFEKAVDGIKNAVNAGMNVSVRYSLARPNIDDIANTYQFVSSLGVSKFKLRALFPDGRAKRRLIPELITGKDLAYAQYNLIQASEGKRTMVEITQPCLYALPSRQGLEQGTYEKNSYKESCPCGIVAAYIDSNGDVKYCLFDEQIFGNTRDDSFVNVWNSTAAKEARQQRCLLDKSGSACSSFKLLYEQFKDYSLFMEEYAAEVRKLEKNINL